VKAQLDFLQQGLPGEVPFELVVLQLLKRFIYGPQIHYMHNVVTSIFCILFDIMYVP